jgi:organic radical activating enzyme
MIKSLCFLTTYRCNAYCDFCECSEKEQDRLNGDDLVRYIDEAKKLGTISQVVFTGGEPTLLGDDLLHGISHATSLGLLTRVVTNGWWGHTPESAERFLDKLVKSGLTEINISIDDLHQRWIPLENVKNAFHACYKLRFKCLIAHKALRKAKITKKFLEDYFNIELIEYSPGKNYGAEQECRLIATNGPIVPVGRKAENISIDQLVHVPFTGNCSSILKDIVVGANHQLLACCGIVTKHLPELTLGDLRYKRMIDIIREANQDLMLNWLTLEGPASIALFVKQMSPPIHFEERYVNVCHLCNELLTRSDIREVLQNHIDKVIDRITLHRAFLEATRGDDELIKLYC